MIRLAILLLLSSLLGCGGSERKTEVKTESFSAELNKLIVATQYKDGKLILAE